MRNDSSRRWHSAFWLLLGVCGCSDSSPQAVDASLRDAETQLDASASEGGTASDGGVTSDGGSLSDASVPDSGPCVPATCGGRTYACGDCVDNDGDGLIDSLDPGCIGACDNSEDVFALDIPGGDTPNCRRDCYFDDDQGAGNDGCAWDSRCDPLSPDAPLCEFGSGGSCVAEQSTTCLDTCRPLVPNGCDCFGCCELPGGSGNFVFLGSTPTNGAERCNPDTVGNPDSCKACTPLPDCFNDCGRCELCLGKTTIPADCTPATTTDGGVTDAAIPDGGVSTRCDVGVQVCGLPGDSACPSGWYCLTGCCAEDILL